MEEGGGEDTPHTYVHVSSSYSLDKCQAAAHWEPQVAIAANLKFSHQHGRYEIAHAQIIEEQKPVQPWHSGSYDLAW